MPHPFANKETEYWHHVSKQSEMPLAGTITIDFDFEKVIQIIANAAGQNTKEKMKEYLIQVLIKDPASFHDLRKLLAISDKRAYLDLSYLAANFKNDGSVGICGCLPWKMARHPLNFFLKFLTDSGKSAKDKTVMANLLASYLLDEGLERALTCFKDFSGETFSGVFELLILPREVQQKAAKLRGHGCEAALAKLLKVLHVDLFPPEKADNPMGSRDPNLSRKDFSIVSKEAGETYSFDMVVLEKGRPKVAIQSLIHTSDPGQYGVNKSDETVHIATSIKEWNKANVDKLPSLELWGLVDGVGFSENKADTINKMLKHFDTFIQLKTLFKAALRLHVLGLTKVSAISFDSTYSKAEVGHLVNLYVPKDIKVVAQGVELPGCVSVSAGLAQIYLEK